MPGALPSIPAPPSDQTSLLSWAAVVTTYLRNLRNDRGKVKDEFLEASDNKERRQGYGKLDSFGSGMAFTGMVTAAALPPDATVPGWRYCNGTAVSRTKYAALFQALGIHHGQGDNSTTFNLPDYRGMFLRGVNDGATTPSYDPDAAGRTAMATGGNTGDAVGSIQDHEFDSHVHTVIPTSFGGTTRLSRDHGDGGGLVIPTTSAGGNETRPVNAYVTYWIKV